jgi:hypothetical protein
MKQVWNIIFPRWSDGVFRSNLRPRSLKNIMWVNWNNFLSSYKVGLFALSERTPWMSCSSRHEQTVISNSFEPDNVIRQVGVAINALHLYSWVGAWFETLRQRFFMWFSSVSPGKRWYSTWIRPRLLSSIPPPPTPLFIGHPIFRRSML